MTEKERDELIKLFKAQPIRCMRLAKIHGIDQEDEWLLDDYINGYLLHKDDIKIVETYILKAAAILRDNE
jgi:hypothetical protein